MCDKRISQTIVKQKVLLVDDSHVTHMLIDALLDGLDVGIMKYDRGKDAIRYYRRHCNDIALVLLDIKLPDATGWDLCKQFRGINGQVPVIGISGVMPPKPKSFIVISNEVRNLNFYSYINIYRTLVITNIFLKN
jgi:CheY-like chemotaxis protein